MDIKTISLEELKKDLKDSIVDIKNCENALAIGATEWSGGKVEDRLNDNKYFVKVITEELERRKLNEKEI